MKQLCERYNRAVANIKKLVSIEQDTWRREGGGGEGQGEREGGRSMGREGRSERGGGRRERECVFVCCELYISCSWYVIPALCKQTLGKF